MNKSNISRNYFLKSMAGIGLAAMNPFGSFRLLSNPNFLNPDLDDDYRVLVCFFMSGGNDSFNMLIPMGSEYSNYRIYP
ncbi:MAG: hypothetical protein R2771_05150 [Saprospiraceae bacterium]